MLVLMAATKCYIVVDVTTLFSRIVTITLAIAISFTVGSSTLNPKTLKP